MAENRTLAQVQTSSVRVSEWRRFRRVFFSRPVVIFGLAVILLMVVIAMAAPLLAPYDPDVIDLTIALQGPSAEHILGTDSLGRDVLSRILYGSRTSLQVGLTVVGIASFVGVSLGLVAGYYGGVIYTVIMRLIDALMSFPMIVLAMVIAALLGGGMRNVIIALSIGMMPQYAKLMCGQVLSIKQSDYVLAETSMGASDLRILIKHVFINALPPFLVLMTMMLGNAILSEASLSFLGIGIAAPTATWGGMVNDGRQYLLTQPLITFAPGFVIMLVVFAFNMAGDGLRDALDPKLRGQL